MPNVFNAHIFKQQQVGDREEVRIKIFGPDGEPLDLTSLGGGGGDPEPEPTGAAMIFKGIWNAGVNYKTNDVVLYNDGSGLKTYIFTQDHNAGIPAFNDVNGFPVTKFFDPLLGHIDLVIDANSHVGGGGMAAGAYDMFMIRVNTPGMLSLKCVDKLSRTQDLGAYIWHQKPDLTWEPLASDDDGAGSGKPWIHYAVSGTHVLPGNYAYYLSKYSAGMQDSASYGDYLITLEGDTVAEVGSFADFPLNKSALLGIGETVSAT